jgi:hypothetical protein
VEPERRVGAKSLGGTPSQLHITSPEPDRMASFCRPDLSAGSGSLNFKREQQLKIRMRPFNPVIQHSQQFEGLVTDVTLRSDNERDERSIEFLRRVLILRSLSSGSSGQNRLRVRSMTRNVGFRKQVDTLNVHIDVTLRVGQEKLCVRSPREILSRVKSRLSVELTACQLGEVLNECPDPVVQIEAFLRPRSEAINVVSWRGSGASAKATADGRRMERNAESNLVQDFEALGRGVAVLRACGGHCDESALPWARVMLESLRILARDSAEDSLEPSLID